MFGKNEVTSPFQKENGSLLVNSMWHTLQGEGPDAGRPAFFLRLSKCNLRCFFCDTEFEDGVERSLEDMQERLLMFMEEYPNTVLLVITGGEPLLQNFIPLANFALDEGLDVSIETAGTVWLDGIDKWARQDNTKIICSPKTPKLEPRLVPFIHAFKYIIRCGETCIMDGLPTYSTQLNGERARLYRGQSPIYIQPMDEGDDRKNRHNQIEATNAALKFGYRLSLQMHKIVGVE